MNRFRIEIVEYNPDWKNDFLKEKSIIMDKLYFLNIDIEHIGSTSVQGLGAKPIIDIMIGLDEHEKLDLLPKYMIDLGLTYFRIYNDVMPERRLFSRLYNPNTIQTLEYFDKEDLGITERGFVSTVNCHCVVKYQEFWKRHIFFRDYLRNNDQAREDYYNLKVELSKKEWDSRNDYTAAKTEFIQNIERKYLLK